MTEQELRAKALEIASNLVGNGGYPVLYQAKDGTLKIDGGFERIIKGIERYLNDEQPSVFEVDMDEVDKFIQERYAEPKT
jgi:hypothetical protein